MMKLLLTIVLAVALMAGVAQALLNPTAEDVETAVETAFGGAATYLELTTTGGGTGDTKDGLTLVTPTNTWAYPDYSDGDIAVNGSCLDEGNWNGAPPGGAVDFMATISGLLLNEEYGVYVVAFGRGSSTEDFSWGTVLDGSPVNVVNDVSYVVGNGGGVEIAGPTGGDTVYSNAVSIGTFTSDGSGEISIWLGKAGALTGEEYRTQFDGIVVTREVLIAWDPSPVSPSANVPLGTDLLWNVPTDANTAAINGWVYNVYFSTDSALPGSPITTVGPNAAGKRLSVTSAQIGGPLAANTYFWRIDSVDPNLSAPDRTRDGDVWTFAAGCTLPTLIDPNDTYDEDVEIDVSLLWSSDPLAITHNVVVTPDGGSPVTLVNKTSGFTPYGNMTMEWNKRYTWQVVEKDGGGVTIATGPAWKFKVRALNCDDPAPLAADADGDCIVNLADFAIMASEWLDCNWDDGGKASPCP